MKKRILLIAAAALLVVGSTAVLAAGQNGRGAGNGTGVCASTCSPGTHTWSEYCEPGDCTLASPGTRALADGSCSYCGNTGHHGSSGHHNGHH